MLELLFLFGYSLHNLEEALWLPAWSKYAERFHAPVQSAVFHFALIIVTAEAFLIAALRFAFPDSPATTVFYGFVCMMVLNVFFPHLLATIALRRYAPGLITGLTLNLPVGALLLYRAETPLYEVLLATVAVTLTTLLLIKLCFRYADRLLPR